MGIMCAPDMIEENMSNLMEGLEFLCTYLDDQLYLFKGHFNEYLEDTKNPKKVTKGKPTYNVTDSSFETT